MLECLGIEHPCVGGIGVGAEGCRQRKLGFFPIDSSNIRKSIRRKMKGVIVKKSFNNIYTTLFFKTV